MFLGRGAGGPKESAWTRKDGQQLATFFKHADTAASSGGVREQLTWMFSPDGDEWQQARVSVGAAVRHLARGLPATVLRKGVGGVAGEGSCHNYWVLDEVEVPDSSAGAGAQR